MLVAAVEARPLRSLTDMRTELNAGIVSLIGPNGAGKTNFLEALYFALTGRSFRTSDRRDLIPFGGVLARAEATIVDEDGIERRLLASVSRQRWPPPSARRSPRRPGRAGAQPPSRCRLLSRPPRLDQGPARGAPRPPRPFSRRSLAVSLGVAAALRAGARAAQRITRPSRRRRRRYRRPGGLGRDSGRSRRAADRRPLGGRQRACAHLRHHGRRARPAGGNDSRVRAPRQRLGDGDPRRPRGAPRDRPAPWPQFLGPPSG